jgi:hypothetical protein
MEVININFIESHVIGFEVKYFLFAISVIFFPRTTH